MSNDANNLEARIDKLERLLHSTLDPAGCGDVSDFFPHNVSGKKKQVIRVLNGLETDSNGGEPGDTEQAHIKADKVLCEFLRFIGHGEVADAFEAHSFWYS